MGPEITQKEMVPFLCNLLKDLEAEVRAAAAQKLRGMPRDVMTLKFNEIRAHEQVLIVIFFSSQISAPLFRETVRKTLSSNI